MTLSLRLFLVLWSALWTLGLPFVLLYLWRRGRKDSAYSAHLGERFGLYPSGPRADVWVHGVSLGEFRAAVPLVRALLAKGEIIVTTHFTPAGRGEAERVFAAEIASGQLQTVWVPFETAWAFRRFFRRFGPRYGLIMEVEVWPRLTFAAKSAGVPIFMCNAKYPSASLAKDQGGLRLRQQVMQGFAGAMVKSEEQARRFASAGVGNIAVTGELRFDQVIPAAHLAAADRLRGHLAERPVITIASAIEGEDRVYIDTIRAVQSGLRVPPLFVYVPRRPERFDEVDAALREAGFRVLRRSAVLDRDLVWQGGGDLSEIDVLLGDSLGEMFFYLALAGQVVVGGGFNPKGAHNIIEPLALRKPVLTGPHVGTIEYPFAEASAAGVARSVESAKELAAALTGGFAPTEAQIERFFAEHAGATARTMEAIPQLLEKAGRV